MSFNVFAFWPRRPGSNFGPLIFDLSLVAFLAKHWSGKIRVELTKPARDVERFTSHPFRIRRGEEDHARCDVLRLTNSAERNSRDERLEAIDESRGMCALGFNRAGIDRIDANFSLGKVLRKGPSQAVHGRFACILHLFVRWR